MDSRIDPGSGHGDYAEDTIDMKTKLVILGGGESGTGAALLGKQQGYEVLVSDGRKIRESFQAELDRAGIRYEEGQHTEEEVMSAGLVVKSPGIPDEAQVVQAVLQAGIPLISEIEFASLQYPGKVIGITGSNGKTTATMLTGHLLAAAGVDVLTGGNIGKSFSRIVAEGLKPDWLVLELSSFQLDTIDSFRPDISVLLNVTADHLDRYAYDIDRYAGAKFRITANQRDDDWFIYNTDSEVVMRNLERHPSKAQKLPVRMPVGSEQIRLSNGWQFSLDKSVLTGRHNALNALCALEVARLAGANEPRLLQEGLDTFRMPPHRLEHLVDSQGGVTFINDSKATNVDAVVFALDAMTRPVIWIAGGTDKGNEYVDLIPLVREKVKAIIALGKDNRTLIEVFGPLGIPIVEVSSAAEAVRESLNWATCGDVVLLSPACASFDRFQNYEDRGNRFKEAVAALKYEEPIHEKE